MTYTIILLVVLAIIALYFRNQKSRTGAQTEETGTGPLPFVGDGMGGSFKNTSIS